MSFNIPEEALASSRKMAESIESQGGKVELRTKALEIKPFG